MVKHFTTRLDRFLPSTDHHRIRRWHECQEVCRRHDPNGDKWSSMLEIEQPDVAGYLRQKHGPDVGNLKRSPLFNLPDSVASVLGAMEFQT